MFGRRTTRTESDLDSQAGGATVAGKGRATPTRKEAEAARKQRLSAPRTRKEQSAAQRAQTKVVRERQRVALNTGDDTYLPARDKGPVKRYARDFVDSRWCIGEVLLPLFFVIFALLFITPYIPGADAVTARAAAISAFAWLVVLVVMGADAVRVVRGVKAGVRERFGESQAKGVAMYAVMRAWQMRRLRLPKPQVSHGDPI